MESYNDPIDPQDWENFKKCCKDGLIVIFWAIVLCVLICMCTSCTTTKYVPVESHTTDNVRITDISRDTLVCRDSIYVELDHIQDLNHIKMIQTDQDHITHIITIIIRMIHLDKS